MTACISVSVARSCITTTIWSPFFHCSRCFRSIVSLALRVPPRAGNAFQAARLVDDSLEETHHRGVVERTGVGPADLFEDLRLARRLIDGHAFALFDAADFERARRARVEQPHQVLVDRVNPLAKILEIAHRL